MTDPSFCNFMFSFNEDPEDPCPCSKAAESWAMVAGGLRSRCWDHRPVEWDDPAFRRLTKDEADVLYVLAS